MTVRTGAWLVASVALHLALLGSVAWAPAAQAPIRQPELQDVWQGHFVDVSTAEPKPPEPQGGLPLAPDNRSQRPAEAPQPPAPVHLPKASPPKASPPKAPPPRAHLPKPTAEPARETKQEPSQVKAPKEPATPEPEEDDWLAPQNPPEEERPPAPAQPKPALRDTLVERILAKERLKAAQREAEQADQRARQAASTVATSSSPAAAPLTAGASDLARKPRDLAKAFTRAVPYATNADPLWSRLPLGEVGRVDIQLNLRQGRILPRSSKLARLDPNSPLGRLEQRTRALIRSGQFALPHSADDSGTQTLRVRVRLSQQQPQDALSVGFNAPTPDSPGLAWFVLESGRRFEAEIRLIP